ncbi:MULTISPECIES: hypothetical protein [unclassified Bradyrhizobium]|uniref:hypothetical protein n=1 Tax=unclassified Bradyrhizobium TaxID=2631580 RepID=UPI0028E630DC|nr:MULTISPECIES: hypothetical protein [unclassified Bradyrhizobium]
MRISQMISVGSLAALVATAAPALAKSSQTPKPDDQATSSLPCRAYQQAPDGTWMERPCQGQGASAPARQRAVTNGAGSAEQR